MMKCRLYFTFGPLRSGNSKIITRVDLFSKQVKHIWVIFRLIPVSETTALLNLPVNRIFLWLPLQDLMSL